MKLNSSLEILSLEEIDNLIISIDNEIYGYEENNSNRYKTKYEFVKLSEKEQNTIKNALEFYKEYLQSCESLDNFKKQNVPKTFH